ncbi:hypothetical protein [Streptacidiphilus sp. EB129]|uniref:hypothetical protein n=1 Tax=Streptacidiphilus sp. EB129 TaxID=3156262 RepID=UPI0035194095
MSSDPWADLANAIFRLSDRFAADRETYEGFLPGSPAAQDAKDEPHAGDWGKAPCRDANIAGLHLAIMAVDHLTCLAGIFQSTRPFVFGPSAVARSATEVAARGYYLLEPDLPSLERIRRHQNDRLSSLWDQRILVKDLNDEVAANACDTQISQILQGATQSRLSPHPGRNYKPPRIGDCQPSATTLVDQAVSKESRLGRTSYRALSAVAHGSRHGLRLFFTEMGALLDQEHGDVFGVLEASPQKMALLLIGAPITVSNLLNRLYTRFGWPEADADSAKYSMLETWGRVAEVPIPTGSVKGSPPQPSVPSSFLPDHPPDGRG